MKGLLIILFPLFLIGCSTLEKSDISLITVENTGKNWESSIIKYSFKKNRFIDRQVIFDEKKSKDKFRPSNPILYKNRYIIDRSAGIYDLKKNKKIFKSIGFDKIYEIIDEKVIFKHRITPYFMNKEDSLRIVSIKAQYYYYDLNKNKIIQFNKGNSYRVKGELSPNKKMGLEYKKITRSVIPDSISNTFFSLFLNRGGSEPLKILDSLSVSLNYISSFFPDLPICWVDSMSFITQKANGELILANLNSEISYFPKLKGLKNELRSPILIKGGTGRVFYYCPTDEEYIHEIDTEAIDFVYQKNSENKNEGFYLKSNEDTLNLYFSEKLIKIDSYLHDEFAISDSRIAIRSNQNYERTGKDFLNIIDDNGELLYKIKAKEITSIIGWIEKNKVHN